MESASSTSTARPSFVRCSPRSIARTMPAKTRKSRCFELRRGCVSKNGMTLVSRSSLRRTTYTSKSVGARSVIRPDATAAQPLLDEVEDLTALGVLADVELGNQLPTGPG